MYAAYIGHQSVVELLIRKSPSSANVVNNRGQTALMLASSCGNVPTVKFLLENGSQVNARDNHGWTSLIHASYLGHVGVVHELLERGCNVDYTEKAYGGMSALMMAAAEGHEQIVAELLKRGADRNIINLYGDTARTLAVRYESKGVLRLLDGGSSSWEAPRAEAELDAGGSRSEWPSIHDGPTALNRLLGTRAVEVPPIQQDDCESWHSVSTDEEPRERRRPAAAVDSDSDDDAAAKTMRDACPVDTPSNVAAVLRSLNLEKYIPVFEAQDIDLQVFWTLNDGDMKEIGVKLMGPRRKITSAIERYKHQRATVKSSDNPLNEQLARCKGELDKERRLRQAIEKQLTAIDDRHNVAHVTLDQLQKRLKMARRAFSIVERVEGALASRSATDKPVAASRPPPPPQQEWIQADGLRKYLADESFKEDMLNSLNKEQLTLLLCSAKRVIRQMLQDQTLADDAHNNK